MKDSQKFDFSRVSDACVKCGKCRPDCTIFKVSRDEVRSPRGFLDLAGAYQRGELELSKEAKATFESCFLCTTCVTQCPTNLPVDEVIEHLRADLAEKYGIAWYKRLFFWLTKHRRVMDFLARVGYYFVPCAFKHQDEPSCGGCAKKTRSNSVLTKPAFAAREMKPRFSLPFLNAERTLPTVSKRSFLNSHPELIDNGGSRQVGIFIGCMANYAYTNVGESLLEICKKLKLNVHLMKQQSCCGSPAYFTGDLKTARELAKRNVAYFEEVLKTCEVIICPEATCSAMLNSDYARILASDEQWARRADTVCAKVLMASEFFAKKSNLKEILRQNALKKVAQIAAAGDLTGENSAAESASGENLTQKNLTGENSAQKTADNATQKADFSRLKVTYHDACHAKKVQNIFKEPRELLREVCDIHEMQDLTSCCGFGGVTMQTQNYRLAREVGVARAKQIDSVKEAQVVAAECSACRLQLNNSLGLINSELRVKNTVELIAEGLK